MWVTWSAQFVRALVGSVPSFLVMDMAPDRMEASGGRYVYSKAHARFGAASKRLAMDRLSRLDGIPKIFVEGQTGFGLEPGD